MRRSPSWQLFAEVLLSSCHEVRVLLGSFQGTFVETVRLWCADLLWDCKPILTLMVYLSMGPSFWGVALLIHCVVQGQQLDLFVSSLLSMH